MVIVTEDEKHSVAEVLSFIFFFNFFPRGKILPKYECTRPGDPGRLEFVSNIPLEVVRVNTADGARKMSFLSPALSSGQTDHT